MPNIIGTGTTTIQDVDEVADSGAGRLVSDGEFEQIFEGLPEVERNINISRIAGEAPSNYAGAGMPPSMDGMVILTNVRHPQETFYIPASTPEGNLRFTGHEVRQFSAGRLVVPRTTADFIKSKAPYVYEEPADGPVFEFKPGNNVLFETRVNAALNEFARKWQENQ